MLAVGTNLKEFADSLLNFLLGVFVEILKKRLPTSTQFNCQLALTEFSDGKTVFQITSEDVFSSLVRMFVQFSVDSVKTGKETIVKNQVNFGFTFNLEAR